MFHLLYLSRAMLFGFAGYYTRPGHRMTLSCYAKRNAVPLPAPLGEPLAHRDSEQWMLRVGQHQETWNEVDGPLLACTAPARSTSFIFAKIEKLTRYTANGKMAEWLRRYGPSELFHHHSFSDSSTV